MICVLLIQNSYLSEIVTTAAATTTLPNLPGNVGAQVNPGGTNDKTTSE